MRYRRIITLSALVLLITPFINVSAEGAKYRDGSLVVDRGTVFIIYQGKKYGFTAKEVFLGLNYKFSNVVAGDLSHIPEGAPIASAEFGHGHGTLININGTIYLAYEGYRTGIPSMEVFNAHKYDLNQVVLHTPADWFLLDNGTLRAP